MNTNKYPQIIQGGMGAGISSWELAHAVSSLGQLGVVSGTALDSIFVRRLQTGDVGGHLKRALDNFPVQEIAQRIYHQYFSSSEKKPNEKFTDLQMITANPSRETQELLVVCNFVEVFLAKEGHHGLVGINFLEKIQMANLPSIYGAMLAGVDYVLMGAGIPREIPGVLDQLVTHQPVELKLYVEGSKPQDDYRIHFFPADIIPNITQPLQRPKFLAIVSSSTLALTLAKKSTGKVDGFVIEGATAGGHNAPPRGVLQLDEKGEPIYGLRDEVNLEIIRDIGLPFWLAGSYGIKGGLQKALALGASGIQVGTPFALCDESGLSKNLKIHLLNKISKDGVTVFTDPVASPTGFPFKIAEISGTISENEIYDVRTRRCDLGYLRRPYKKEDGSLGYRCPGEPIKAYVAKGGESKDAEGRKCLCNSLLANINLPQSRKNQYIEKPLVTIGENVNDVKQFLNSNQLSYSASDVIQTLMS